MKMQKKTCCSISKTSLQAFLLSGTACLYSCSIWVYMWQHWKGKQNKNLKTKKNWRKLEYRVILVFYIIAKSFSYWIKVTSCRWFSHSITNLYWEIYVPFQWCPLYFMKIRKGYARVDHNFELVKSIGALLR
jgi:hypothetical protein